MTVEEPPFDEPVGESAFEARADTTEHGEDVGRSSASRSRDTSTSRGPRPTPRRKARKKRRRASRGDEGTAKAKPKSDPTKNAKTKSSPPERPSDADRDAPLYAAQRALERWLREHLRAQSAEGDLPAKLEIQIPVEFDLNGRAPRSDRRRVVALRRALEQEIDRIHGERRVSARGWVDGHLWCHWCNAPTCEHSSPPSGREVFVGYEPTGKPCWRELASWLIEHSHPDMERLFDDRPRALGHYTPGVWLRRNLLPSFRENTGGDRLIAQVVAGYFPLPDAVDPRGVALTLHLMESRTPGGDVAYDLNVLCGGLSSDRLGAAVAERRERSLARFVMSVRTQIRELSERLIEVRRQGQRPRRNKIRDEACELFSRIPAGLDKIHRQGARRTVHAEDRARQSDRPTASAFEDARSSRDENYYRDRKEGTIVVRGPNNRVHVFRDDGTHITSIVYSGATIRDRQQARRWVPLAAKELRAFREALRSA